MTSTHTIAGLSAMLALLGVVAGAAAETVVPEGDLRDDPDARGFAELLFVQGTLAWIDADGEAALARFDRADATWPQDATYSYFAGAAALSLRRFDVAAVRLSKALPPAPSRVPGWRVHSDLGAAHYLAGNSQLAEPQLRRALELHPTDAAAHFNLGLVLLDLGRPAESVPHFEAARTHARGLTTDSHFYIGVAALREGKTETARHEFETARETARSVRHSIPEIMADLHAYLDLLEGSPTQ